MANDRPCNVRKSKQYPDAYTKEELVELVVSQYGYKKTEARSMTKDALCKIIGKKSSKANKQQLDKIKVDRNRPCGVRKSKNNPSAYSKDELIKLAIRSGMSEKGIQRKTMSELCEFLFGISKEDEVFNVDRCQKYPMNQLKKFAKLYKVAPKRTKKQICDNLIKVEIRRLWNECLKADIGEIKEIAKSKGISTRGKQSDICRRIFEHEKKNVPNERDDYSDFFDKYFNSKESRDNVIELYNNILPLLFMSNFKKLNHKQRKDWFKNYINPENIDQSYIDSIKNYIHKLDLENDGCNGAKCNIDCDVPNLPCVKNSRLKLKLHQIRIVKAILNQRGLYAWHSAGSGKTLSAVTAIQCILDKFPKMRIAIVTPTSLQENIKKEIKAYGADPNDKRFYYSTINKFVNDNPIHLAKKFKNTFLIVDEAHNLRKYNGGLSKVFIEYAKYASKVLLLSATATPNRPNEIVNAIAMIDGTDPITPDRFDKEIMTNEEAFNNYFSCKISYFECDNEGYPEEREHIEEFTMSQSYYKKYYDIEKKFESDLSKKLFGEGKNLKVFFNGIRRASNNLEAENGPKINWIVDKIVSENKKNPRNKTLIYSAFLEAGVKLVMKRLEKLNISYVKVDGSMSKLQRKDAVNNFNSGEISVIIISEAGGEGLDLKGVRHEFIMEPSWNMANLIQVKHRGKRFLSHAHLPKKEQIVDVWYLYLVKPDKRFKDDIDMESIDIEINDIAMEKQAIIDDFVERLIPLTIENIDKQQCVGA